MKRRALLIGVNQYHLLGNLSYARQDAEAVAGALCQHCGFTEQDITLMTCQSEGASMGLSRYIEHALINLTDEKDIDLLVFGFWGHGFAPVSARRYLCGVDTAENDLERTAVSMDVVKAKLAQVQAENTLLILDCCQNRPSGRSASAEPMTKGEETTLASIARDIQAASTQQMHDSIPTVAILNACREGQKAYEWNQRKHGIFTAHLLDAFEQGFTSIAPLSSWLFDRVAKTSRDLHQQSQTPYITIEGKGDISLSGAVSCQESVSALDNEATMVSQHDSYRLYRNTVNEKEVTASYQRGGKNMASVKCSKCARKIGTTVNKCPHCGASSDNIRTAAAGLETLLTLGEIIQDDGSEPEKDTTDKEMD